MKPDLEKAISMVISSGKVKLGYNAALKGISSGKVKTAKKITPLGVERTERIEKDPLFSRAAPLKSKPVPATPRPMPTPTPMTKTEEEQKNDLD